MEQYGICEKTGIWKQLNPIEKKYDTSYIDNSYNKYGDLGIKMSYLRLGFLRGAVGSFESICDVGYGNGDFLYACKESGVKELYGVDVSGYKLKDNDIIQLNEFPFEKEFDIVTFFDSLEHFNDITFVEKIKAKCICISYPECHFPTNNEWFMNWKHRRPNEHIYHFGVITIKNYFSKIGYKLIQASNIEDTIRKRYDKNLWNITTLIFRKR